MTDVGARHIARHHYFVGIVRADRRVVHRAAAARPYNGEVLRPADEI